MAAASANAMPPRLPERQEIIGRNRILQDQDDQPRAPHLPNFGSRQNEIAVHIKIANRNMLMARPVSERVR
jgi:hypothetical protein